MLEWLTMDWTDVPMVLLSVVAFYAALIVCTRVAGLRSFSKMSGFDFAMTVALGSLFASTIATKSPSLLQGMLALVGLYGGQVLIARLRLSTSINKVVDNRPQLLMYDGQVLHQQLKNCRVAESDLRAKLREANVLHYGQVRAVVFETTGDISVLHAGDDTPLSDDLLHDVGGLQGVPGLDMPPLGERAEAALGAR